uniref:Neurotransmitter-gated ion-channel ligand-binding domain-containing protein n=1 Tax=Acrobeloides nanus TaxID=290746 RepID=A0A914CLZ7_9BILA
MMVCHLFSYVSALESCANDTEVIDHILYDTALNYNRHKLPNNPVTVRIELWIQEVTSVSELTQDFEIDLYVNEFWEDPALAYDYLRPCKGNMSFDYKMQDNIWIPNTVFINSKSAQIHSSPFRNVFLMVFPNGSIWACWRIKGTGPCLLNLRPFPLDSMTCYLTLESYNYNRKGVQMIWNMPQPLQLFKEIELPDFSMVNHSYSVRLTEYPAGFWDELTVDFKFQRRYGWYFLQGYIPTYLTIFISWIPFYLGPKAIPARTMIGVNALIFSGMTFVFASLIELAAIGYMTRNEERSTFRIKELKRKRKRRTAQMNSEQLDLFSRIAFP